MEDTRKEIEFKKRYSPPVIYFTATYTIIFVYTILQGKMESTIAIGVTWALILIYLFLIRPYKYVITRRTLEIHRRIGGTKEINLMSCETICDPVPKMTKIITDPRTLEIYLEGGKRITVSPKMNIEFVSEVIKANKRINCQVKEYNETHRKFEKKRRREVKKETREAE